jgi:uncharacterized repeat protein (TIGR02543 family)
MKKCIICHTGVFEAVDGVIKNNRVYLKWKDRLYFPEEMFMARTECQFYLIQFMVEGKWGFADIYTGEIKIQPIWDYAGPFYHGYAHVSIGNKIEFMSGQEICVSAIKDIGNMHVIGGKHGYIDRNNKIIIPVEYDYAEEIPDGTYFNVRKGKKWCAVNEKNRIIPDSDVNKFAETTMQRASAATKTDGKFNYEISGSNATITGLADKNTTGPLEIPDTINEGGSTYAVTSINGWAFDGCTALTGVTIPDSVTTIGGWAFSGCTGLAGKLTIPDSVMIIGRYAFDGCTCLTEFYVGIGNAAYSSKDGVLYDISQSVLIRCPCGKSGLFTVPNSVATICSWAFDGCTRLTAVTIPDNLFIIGKWAFSGCTSLTEFDVASGNAIYSSKDGVIYDISRSILICYPCGKTGQLTIPDNVTEIDYDAFGGCTGMEAINALPANAPEIKGDEISGIPSTVVLYTPNTLPGSTSYKVAPWTNFSRAVIFDSDGGTAVPVQRVAFNGYAKEPEPPSKAGYEFGGWCSDSGLNTSFDFVTSITASMTLYAKWFTPEQ